MREPGQSLNNHVPNACVGFWTFLSGGLRLLGTMVLYTARAILSHWEHIVLRVGVRWSRAA